MNNASHPETNVREPVELPPVNLDETPNVVRERTATGSVVTSRRGIYTKISGDVVNRHTQNLPDRERSAIRRFHAHYVENDLNIRDAAKLARTSEAAISQVFNGKYPGRLEPIIKEIENFFELEEERAQGRRLPFIETDLTKRIFSVCEKAREFQKIAFIFGDGQIGKSTTLEEYQKTHNHGSTVYTYIPAGGNFTNFLFTFCKPFRIAINTGLGIMRQRILDSIDDRMLLIVDEAHQAIPEASGQTRSNTGIKCIEFVREIFNAKKCGVVICATNVFKKEMDQGALSTILAQTKRRRLCTLQLPNVPTQDDLNKFAAEYGLPPSSGPDRELEKYIIAKEALGMWLTLLRMAAKIAAEDKETMTWQHVHLADAAQKALEGKTH